MFDMLAKRCGEGDRDHAVITTVLFIDDRDISLERRVFLLGDYKVHVHGDWSQLRGEVFTGRGRKRPGPPGQGVVYGPVQQ